MLETYQINGTRDHVYVNGNARQAVKLDAEGFFSSLLSLPQPRMLDLMLIATGVYAVDRISQRHRPSANRQGIRQLRIEFAVRDIKFWSSRRIQKLLLDILSFLTDDDWQVGFHKLQNRDGYQEYLEIPKFHARHGALYSGGLDSAAGLVNRLLQGTNNLVLVTVGHQHGLHTRIKRQLDELGSILTAQGHEQPSVLHSTLTTSLEGGKAHRLRDQERTQRSRSFLFCVAALAAGNAYCLETMEMFENGVGAINLPLMTGMLGGGLSTRGAHPSFLRLVSELGMLVTEKQIELVLPYRHLTKAEMLAHLRHLPELGPWLQQSRSCVHTSIREQGKTHCGRCAACIERRQAFLIAGLVEDLSLYQSDVRNNPPFKAEEEDYFYLYRLDALKWNAGREEVWRRMSLHLRLTNVPETYHESIFKLQSRHAREVLHAFGPPFHTALEEAKDYTQESRIGQYDEI
jgi:7-cyano-7-deazaguanine synthase in queuosine biosynthesis